VRDIFPADYYREIQENLPPAEAMQTLEQARATAGYPERFIMALGGDLPAVLSERQRLFWRDFARWVHAGTFGRVVISRFADIIERRMQEAPDMYITDELMLVRDRTRYSLGPHTDSARKLVSVLFYLPADASLERHGTSMYVPKDPGFTCAGGEHHSFERFERVATMPFLPNSVFAFAKTPNAFHGVEPIGEPGVERNLLLYDLRMRKPAVRFSM
jgi:hypothetical protein